MSGYCAEGFKCPAWDYSDPPETDPPRCTKCGLSLEMDGRCLDCLTEAEGEDTMEDLLADMERADTMLREAHARLVEREVDPAFIRAMAYAPLVEGS